MNFKLPLEYPLRPWDNLDIGPTQNSHTPPYSKLILSLNHKIHHEQ